MKYLFLLLITVSLAFASGNHGCTETSTTINPHESGSDAVTLTIVNDWTLADQILGIDFFDGAGDYVLAVNNTDDIIQAYDPATGAPTGTMTLDAANTSAFGLAWNNDPDTDTYYVNDFQQTVLYYTEDFGTSWTTTPAPGGSNSRGMAFDGTDYWTTNGTGGGLLRFQPGVGTATVTIPEVADQPSGLTVFPHESNLGIAVTCYNTHSIYFYDWDGSAMTFLGSAACPASGIGYSMGLAYGANGNLFWSYWVGTSEYHLAELSFEITSLTRSSWASIKTSF